MAARRGGLEGAAAHYACACGGAAAGDLTSIIYALQGDALYRSCDQGETWADLAVEGVEPRSMEALAVDPANQAILYATLRDSTGLICSLDGGITWRRLTDDN
jgi:hypothetical protein